MIGVDTSFLVALALREHPSHATSWDIFQTEIVGGNGTMAVASQVLAEFCHIVTDARRFETPVEMTRALAMCEEWWTAQECRPITVTEEAGVRFLGWMREHSLGRKRLLDTLLAATYSVAGVRRIATTNWRDFSIFGTFEILPV